MIDYDEGAASDIPVGLDDLPRDARQIFEIAREWPADRKAGMLAWLKAQHTRETIKKRYRHPAELAKSIDPNYNITPAIRLISESVERTIREPQRNLLVTMPPQEGKSNLCAVWAPIRALQLNPDCRVILATYGDTLAEDHSTTARSIIQEHGTGVVDQLTGMEVTDKVGLSLATNRLSAWRVKGGKGGMVAVGLGSSITGRPADLMIIDDPYKNMIEADSATHRRKVDEWMKSVAFTRLAPDASVILIQTRWHPDDLAGSIIESERELPREDRTWRHINIPAVAEVGIPDALNRAPGEAMVSARGRSEKAFRQIRTRVGERVWYALYEGVPAPPEGGLFSRKWFEAHRLPSIPAHPVLSVVGVDPAESGKNDEAGIVSASLYGDRTTVFTHDRSGHMTSDQWARASVTLALEIGAQEIAVEAYSSATTYETVMRAAWRAVHNEAVALHATGAALEDWQTRALASQMPFRIHMWRGTGDSVARSAGLRQAVETGTAVVAGAHTVVFEDQAATWQQGQHQPDRVAAAIIAHSRIVAKGGMGAEFASPTDVQPARPAPSWLARKL